MATILVLQGASGPIVYPNKLCCPNVTNATLLTVGDDAECCRCGYEVDLEESITAGCGGSTYFPNNCGDSETTTQDVVFGPFAFACTVEVGEGGLSVDDDLVINDEIFEAGQHLVNLTASSTGYDDGEGGCEYFDGGESECNGAHTIPEGTVLATLAIGESVTLRALDNHGIELYMRGKIDVIPT